MLRETLKTMIPDLYSSFDKLTKEESYYFDKWGYDLKGEECLYYWFWDRSGTEKNQKRTPISEIKEAIRVLLDKGNFSRKDFEKHCPVSLSAGPCGFAVIGRILEYIGVARYTGRGRGFKIASRDRASQLLGF